MKFKPEKLFRFSEGTMTEKDWVSRYAGRVVEHYRKSHYDLIDKKKWNRMDAAEQKEYEDKLKKKIEQPEYRAYRKNEDEIFVVVSKDTFSFTENSKWQTRS